MEKYFTPEITDLKIGYECEHTSNPTVFKIEHEDRIIKDQLYPHELIDIIKWVNEEGEDLEDFVRVPYLTKQDFENEGYTHYESGSIGDEKELIYMENDMYLLTYWFGTKRLFVYSKEEEEHFVMHYLCKSLNDFRDIINKIS